MNGYWVREVTTEDVWHVAAAVVDAYRAGAAWMSPFDFLLADRSEHLVTGLLHPEHSPTPNATAPAAALAWMVADCADDEHAAMWLAGVLANLGLSMADVVRQADPDGRYLRGMASFGGKKSDYAWVPLVDLPPPHNPFRCGYIDQFNRQRRRQARLGRLRELWGMAPWTDLEVALRAGDRFRADQPCASPCDRWHKTPTLDWASLSALCREVFDRVGDEDWTEAEVTATSRRVTSQPKADLIAAQFRDPVTWSPGAKTVTNGQHRLLAYHAAGVRDVLVRVS